MPTSEATNDLLLGGGFCAGIAAVLVAVIGSGDNQQSRRLQSYEQARLVSSTNYAKELESQSRFCDAAIRYLEDEKPNNNLTVRQKEIAFNAVMSGIHNCAIRPTAPSSASMTDSDTPAIQKLLPLNKKEGGLQ